MKLDMLFELQPKPQPWTKPHPYGQRVAEQIVYYEALEQVKLADKLGFGTVWCVEHHFREGRHVARSRRVRRRSVEERDRELGHRAH